MKPAMPPSVPDIIRKAIERVTADPHRVRREIVQSSLDDLAAAGYGITHQRAASAVKGKR